MSDNTNNIEMDQGSSYTYTWTLKNADLSAFNLTGYDARMQVRADYGSTNTLINCTVANNKLALGGVLGTVVLTLAPIDTSSIRFPGINDDAFECVYDLEIISAASKVYKPARGTFTLLREVTR